MDDGQGACNSEIVGDFPTCLAKNIHLKIKLQCAPLAFSTRSSPVPFEDDTISVPRTLAPSLSEYLAETKNRKIGQSQPRSD